MANPRVRLKIDVIRRRDKHDVVVALTVGIEVIVQIRLATFEDRKIALACRDRIYEALGAPF